MRRLTSWKVPVTDPTVRFEWIDTRSWHTFIQTTDFACINWSEEWLPFRIFLVVITVDTSGYMISNKPQYIINPQSVSSSVSSSVLKTIRGPSNAQTTTHLLCVSKHEHHPRSSRHHGITQNMLDLDLKLTILLHDDDDVHNCPYVLRDTAFFLLSF